MPGGVNTYVLTGGPCDGKIGQLSPSIDQSGQIVCQQHLYKRTNPAQVQGGHEVFKDSGPVPTGPPAGNAAHAHHGWNDLRHSVNHNMPAALRAAQHSTRAALRSLGRGRKVRP